MTTTSPPGRVELLSANALALDPRLQMRAGGATDPGTVARYAEVMADRLAAADPAAGGADPRLGFPAAEAVYDRVRRGTFRDAKRLALSANADHGRARDDADCRNAVGVLLDDPALLAEVVTAGRGKGGTERAVAAATGTSHGLVGKVLAARGLRADRRTGQLVPRPPAADDPGTPSCGRAGRTTGRGTSPQICGDPSAPGLARAGETAGPVAGFSATAAVPVIGIPTDPGPLTSAEAALAAGEAYDEFDRHLRAAIGLVDRMTRGAAGTHLLAARLGDERVFELAPVRRGPIVQTEGICRSLDLVRRTARARRLDRVCAGCNGAGCRACGTSGIVPADPAVLGNADVTPSLFRGLEYTAD